MMGTKTHARVISYLKECYRSDNREVEILNVMDKKIDFRLFIETEDALFNGQLFKIPVSHAKIADIAKTAAMLKREKTLLLGFAFVAGTMPIGRETVKICSPLWLVPAQLEETVTGFQLIPLPGRAFLNYPLLRKLETLTEQESIDDDLFQKIPGLPLTEPNRQALTAILKDLFPFLDQKPFAAYPAQKTEKQLKNILRRKKKQDITPALHSATALLLCNRSPESRGVLAELEAIARMEDISLPMQALFAKTAGPATFQSAEAKRPRQKLPLHRYVPVVLSPTQKNVLANTLKSTLNLVIGPPGTGKSFTIAAVALDHLSYGENVLITAKTNQAVDVVADKIENILGVKNFVIRGGKRHHVKEIKQFIENLLNGIFPFPDMSADEFKAKKEEQLKLRKEIVKLEKIISHRSLQEQRWGRIETSPPGNFFGNWVAKTHTRYLEWRFRTHPSYWELMHRYQNAIQRYLDLSRELLKKKIRNKIEAVTNKKRNQLKRLSKALSSIKSSRQEMLFSKIDFQVIFKAFPVWLVKQSEVSRVLPLQSSLFDILLVDEATQCDIASAVPLLYRSRRAVVIGDPHQLRHISFLSRNRQAAIAEKAGLEEELHERFDYRRACLLDLTQETISSQRQVFFLDEHFRSLPPIIRFSNRTFYGNCLKIMQELPTNEDKDCLHFQPVEGSRDESGVNEKEAAALITKVKSIIWDQSHRPDSQCDSIGVLSPFSAQTERLSKLLAESVSTKEIDRHNILVGTPYSFQGEERDTMLIGLCVDKESHSASFRYLNRADVFNVSITRARNRQIIFGSFSIDHPKVKGILKDYLNFIIEEEKRTPETVDHAADPFLAEVRDALTERQWRCYPNFPVAGFHVDLLVVRGGVIMGIDLIGYPGPYCDAFQLERYRLFNRADLPIFPLTYHAWRTAPNDCLTAIEMWLNAKLNQYASGGSPRAPVRGAPRGGSPWIPYL